MVLKNGSKVLYWLARFPNSNGIMTCIGARNEQKLLHQHILIETELDQWLCDILSHVGM